MIRRQTWILLAVFALLAALAWYWQSQGITISKEEATPTPQPRLFTVDAAVIKTFDVADALGNSAALEQVTVGVWRLAGQETELADPETANAVVSQLLTLRVLATLAPPPDPSATGLAQPLYEVKFTTQDGNAFDLTVGAKTPTQSGYYVRSQGKVMVVGATAIDGLPGLLLAVQPTPTPGATVTATP
ncbi:MAG: DUF4340 domain-containing protein [Chloroflexi bacterium]|nr:DUF4340 domain-containing protein [Chloroflexota bacterium]